MVTTVTIQDLTAASKVIDIRATCEYVVGHLHGAVNIPYEVLMMYPETYLKRDEVYYLICAHGSLSQRACAILQSYGYDVANIKNGYDFRCYCW